MKHPYDRLGHIATPRDGMANCGTHDKYVARHEFEMLKKVRGLPALGFRMPWLHSDRPVPFVAGGKWVVLCECGDAPMASHEWDEARCFNCGAIYRGLSWPRERQTIEALLTARPMALVRTWLPTESASDLREQNRERGIGDKARNR